MIIANPIYDPIFKRLMEDISIAQGFISRILGRKIHKLSFCSQENSHYIPENNIHDKIKLFHLDFVAEIETEFGTEKVLIELQKSSAYAYTHRFRAYIGELYTKAKREYDDLVKKENIEANEQERKVKAIAEPEILPVIPIFIFGFELNPKAPDEQKLLITEYRRKAYNPNKKIKKEDGKILSEEVDAGLQLANYLSHDLIIIQIPYLPEDPKTELEKTLSIFEQRFLQKDQWYKDYRHHFENDPLLKTMLKKLNILAEDEKVADRLNREEEGQLMYDNIMAGIREDKERIVSQKQELEGKNEELASHKQELEGKNEDLASHKQELLNKEKALNKAKEVLLGLGKNEQEINELLNIK